MVILSHPTRRKNEGKNLGRKHQELSEWRRAFARKKQKGKRAERKSARKKHKTTRARSRQEELTFGTFNVRTAAVNGVNGIRHIDTLLRSCAAKVMTLSDCRRPKGTKLPKFRPLDTALFFWRKEQLGVGLAIKEEVVKKDGEDGIAIECISARLMKA